MMLRRFLARAIPDVPLGQRWPVAPRAQLWNGRALSARAVNLTLLVLVTLELLSGLGSLLVGAPSGRWVFWLHSLGGLAIALLIPWKWVIARRGYRRRGLSASTFFSTLFGALLLASLATGLLWSTTGLRGLRVPLLGSLTGLGVHIALTVLLIPLFVLHTAGRWQKPRRADFASRRATLRYASLSLAGLVLWRGSEGLAALASSSGSTQRFTGSREIGSLSGNGFPTTNWLSDPQPAIDAHTWRLSLGGMVARPVSLALIDLERYEQRTLRATLDCTGGWYTTQDWRGVPLSALLAGCGVAANARSLVVRSRTGYQRRFPLAEAERLLLVTHTANDPLTRGHGFPARLVAPGYRGFEWVKWVVEIEVSDAPAWWQAPLPLQ